jgi:hypothetical protein
MIIIILCIITMARQQKYREGRILVYQGGAHKKFFTKKSLKTNKKIEKQDAFWKLITKAPLHTWIPYKCSRYEPMDQSYVKSIMQKMNKLKTTNLNLTLAQWAKTRKTKAQQIGAFGEAFIYLLIKTELKTAKSFQNTFPVLRDVEDQDPIDMSFVFDNTFVHCCVKCSTQKYNNLKSSTSFFTVTKEDLNCPRATIVVRCRFSRFDLLHPMGPQVKLMLNINRNF